MPRPPLDDEAKKAIMIRLIQTTQDIIFSEGLETVTIRKIARIAKINSATLYKYFKDLDELILYASTDLLKDYTQELIYQSRRNKSNDPKLEYLMTWKLFCHYSFRYPECMNHLFFGKHSSNLEHIIPSYYDLFAEQIEGMSISLQAMIRCGNLYQRNLEVLAPIFEKRISLKRLSLINNLTVSYFRELLNEKVAAGDELDNEVLTQRMMYACRQILLLAHGLTRGER